jgi:hypothetical protein
VTVETNGLRHISWWFRFPIFILELIQLWHSHSVPSAKFCVLMVFECVTTPVANQTIIKYYANVGLGLRLLVDFSSLRLESLALVTSNRIEPELFRWFFLIFPQFVKTYVSPSSVSFFFLLFWIEKW